LLEHAPEDSIEFEVKPYALGGIGKARRAFEENRFTELLQLLGTGDNRDPLSTPLSPRFSSPWSRFHPTSSPTALTCTSDFSTAKLVGLIC